MVDGEIPIFRTTARFFRSQEDFQQACDDAQLGFVDSLPAPWQRWDFGVIGIWGYSP
jgi:hypothetical protein